MRGFQPQTGLDQLQCFGFIRQHTSGLWIISFSAEATFKTSICIKAAFCTRSGFTVITAAVTETLRHIKAC